MSRIARQLRMLLHQNDMDKDIIPKNGNAIENIK
jgi:hypothetical protein